MSFAAPRLLHGSFRTLVEGQCLGQAADGLAQIAFAQFIVFEAGRGASPGRLASLFAVTLLPFSLVGPFAGVLIDRWPRRRVLVLVSWLRAGLVVVAAGTVLAGSQAGAYACVLLLLSTSRFVLAAKGASIPRTVPADDLVPANAVSSVAGMSATFAGAVGGATFVGRSSLAGFVGAAGLYVAAGLVFTRLHGVGGGLGGPVSSRLRRALSDVAEGLRAVRRPEIGRPLSAVWLHRLLLGAGFVVLVLVADSRFHLEITGYGLALAVTGLAAFAGSVAAPICARRWRREALLAVSFLPPVAAAYAAGMFPDLAVLVTALAVTSLCFQLLKVVVDAMVGGASADAVRGRVFSVYDVLYNVAFVLAGLLMVPLWDPARVTNLLWWLGAAFAGGWVLYARLFRLWPWRDREPVLPVRHRWRGRVLALILGALPVLAFPAPAWWWLAWVALVPLLLHLRATPTSREAAVRGWWAGAGYVVAATYWLLPVTGPALPLVGLLLGVLWAPWGWTARRMLGPPARPATVLAATAVLPSLWVLIEAARSWSSLGGPWALIGATQWNQPLLLASAAMGGVWLTSFLVVAVNVALVGLLVVRARLARVLLTAVAVVALGAGPVWAAGRPSPAPSGALRVGVVQLPAMPLSGRARLDAQIRLTDGLVRSKPDLVVWGESSVAVDLRHHPGVVRRLVGLARRTGADLLVNVDAMSGSGQIRKTTALVTPSGLDGSYAKTRLVPFGEYIPLRSVLGWVADISKAAPQNRGRGSGPVVLHDGTVPLGPLICFESTFPDMSRAEARLGAALIVYQTADSTFQGSWEQPQQASLSAVRAVETGRPVVQAALTGTSAAFDGTGRRLLWVDAGRTAATVRTVSLTQQRTPFDVAGPWVLAASAGIVAAGLVAGSLAAARRTTVGTPPENGSPLSSASDSPIVEESRRTTNPAM